MPPTPPTPAAHIHTRFDLAHWKQVFPLTLARSQARSGLGGRAEPSGDRIVGPASVAYLEQLRAESGSTESLGPGYATDLLVWAIGEPPHPSATKVGGLPYRPASEAWPTNAEGKPSTFVGQVCFADSREILLDRKGKRMDLPGDVLVFFSTDASGIWDDDDENAKAIQYEWWPLGLANLLEAGGVPAQEWRASLAGSVVPCHAQLHRTMDYTRVPRDHPLRDERLSPNVRVTEGGKIGGVPYFVQDADPPAGEFACAIGSIATHEAQHPLIGVADKADPRHPLCEQSLIFGDVGTLYFFLEPRGILRKTPRLHWRVQGY